MEVSLSKNKNLFLAKDLWDQPWKTNLQSNSNIAKLIKFVV